MKLRSLLKDDHADVRMIGAVVGIFITIIIGILVFYNIAASLDANSVDNDIGDDMNFDVSNATNDTLDQAATFFQVAPIIGIIVVAVVILGYVGRIGG